ncbi:hypothetical protein NBO_38g0009 [Nosema bombycis CQ1]|jgi:hypothetical protein|uniref:Uncharacterized protein n=1 Tax=Nosema bombycis (strain CQ1 / CVCC 102059) TaxID=578461 RepID=R0MMK7_NOSB1|nr:hypothetical protein NBO_38g0009 [Nosema bombycis CQ1]|eukprot:EOB14098.1 hypothetical protein NBO_38g0009 [Nosema bombycis CQ1]
MKRDHFIEGSREEEKRVSLLNIKGDKYRLIYSKVYGDSIAKDILKIEISTNFKVILPQIKEIIEKKAFTKIHLFIKYEEFLNLESFLDEQEGNSLLIYEGYEVKFVFIPKEYLLEEYVLVYEVNKIE